MNILVILRIKILLLKGYLSIIWHFIKNTGLNILLVKHKRQYAPILAARRAASLYVLLQFSLALIIAVVLWGTLNGQAALSVIYAAVAVALPSLYFIRRLYSISNGYNPERIVRGLYAGEAGKFGLSIIIITLVLALTKVNLVVFITAFAVLHIMIIFAPFITDRKCATQ